MNKDTYIKENGSLLFIRAYTPKAVFAGNSPDYRIRQGSWDKLNNTLRIQESKKNYTWLAYKTVTDITLKCEDPSYFSN